MDKYNKAITVRLKDKDYNTLAAMADAAQTTISSIIRSYIVKIVKQEVTTL